MFSSFSKSNIGPEIDILSNEKSKSSILFDEVVLYHSSKLELHNVAKYNLIAS